MSMDQIHLSQKMNRLQSLVKIIMNQRSPKEMRDSFTDWLFNSQE